LISLLVITYLCLHRINAIPIIKNTVASISLWTGLCRFNWIRHRCRFNPTALVHLSAKTVSY